MAEDFASLLSSDMVLIAAEGESKFFVHKDVLALQSPPFRETLSENSPYLIVNLQDWDHATVARLVEFLYRGMYFYPDPVAISPGNAAHEVESTPARPKALTAVPHRNAADDLKRLNRFDPALYDYKEPLLSHAKVYQLAHSGAIYPLRKLALRHLLDTLKRIDSIGPATGHHTVVAICNLVRNVYACNAYAPIDPPEFKDEGLQSHVSKFIARNFAALRSNSEMVQLLSEGGDIVIDVMGILSNGPSITLPSVPLPVATLRPAAVRSGPVPCVVLPPVASRPAFTLSAVLPPVSTPPVASRPVTSPSVAVGVIRPAPLVENRFISQLMISDSPIKCPKFGTQIHDRVNALNGKSGNIGEGNEPVWLYVGYTKYPSGACTSFTADMKYKAQGAVPIGPNRSIVLRRETYVRRKITRVALVRRGKVITDISTYAGGVYNGMTSDLTPDGDHTYLVWKSEYVDPKKVLS